MWPERTWLGHHWYDSSSTARPCDRCVKGMQICLQRVSPRLGSPAAPGRAVHCPGPPQSAARGARHAHCLGGGSSRASSPKRRRVIAPTAPAPDASTNRTTQELFHAFPEVTWHEGIQNRVDPRVKVHYEECNGGEEGRKVAAPVVIRRPVLPHLAGVIWEVAQCEGQHHDYQHPYDAATRPQHAVRRLCHQWRPTERPGLAVE